MPVFSFTFENCTSSVQVIVKEITQTLISTIVQTVLTMNLNGFHLTLQALDDLW